MLHVYRIYEPKCQDFYPSCSSARPSASPQTIPMPADVRYKWWLTGINLPSARLFVTEIINIRSTESAMLRTRKCVLQDPVSMCLSPKCSFLHASFIRRIRAESQSVLVVPRLEARADILLYSIHHSVFRSNLAVFYFLTIVSDSIVNFF